MIGPDGQFIVGDALSGQLGQQTQITAVAPSMVVPLKPAGEPTEGEETAADQPISESDPDDDDDMENWISVTAIEAELRPKVIQTFDTIAGSYKRLRRLQDQDIQFQLKRSRSLRGRSASIGS